jgi:hypothetical protein
MQVILQGFMQFIINVIMQVIMKVSMQVVLQVIITVIMQKSLCKQELIIFPSSYISNFRVFLVGPSLEYR